MVDDAPDTFSLVGRTALVTGSSRGLGAATARRLARAGCDVVITYRKQADAARTVAAEIERRTHPMRATMSPDDVAEAVVALCTDAARLMSGSVVRADGAGVFAFCGRYITLSAEAAMASSEGLADAADAAPSVIRSERPSR